MWETKPGKTNSWTDETTIGVSYDNTKRVLNYGLYPNCKLGWVTRNIYLRWGLITLPIIAWTCWASHTHKLRSTASVFPLKLYRGTDSRTGSTMDHKSWTPIATPVCFGKGFNVLETYLKSHDCATTRNNGAEHSNRGAARATFQLALACPTCCLEDFVSFHGMLFLPIKVLKLSQLFSFIVSHTQR